MTSPTQAVSASLSPSPSRTSSPTPKPTATASATPSPTPSPSLDLFVIDGAGQLEGEYNAVQFLPPYTGVATATYQSVGLPTDIAFDGQGNFFIDGDGAVANPGIVEIVPPYIDASDHLQVVAQDLNIPVGIAYANGDLFVANSGNSTVTVYAPPFTSGTGAPVTTITNGLNEPQGIAFDANGDLFVANAGNGTVTEYASPYTGAPVATVSTDVARRFASIASVSPPYGVALDTSGDLFVSIPQASTVTEYAAPYTGAPIATITNGVNVPEGIAVAANGDLFVANNGSNSITEYAPPYTAAPFNTITNNVYSPLGLKIGLADYTR
jgi:hypothetical protein